jgi:hypothetical protein
MEFQNIGIWQKEWDKFNSLSTSAKAFIKSKGSVEKPQPFMELFILPWPGDWQKQLQQLNEAIKRHHKRNQSTNILSAKLRQFQLMIFFVSWNHYNFWGCR